MHEKERTEREREREREKITMSQNILVPYWNLSHHEGEAGDRSSHVHSHHTTSTSSTPHLVSMPKYEVAHELTWANGQLVMNGHGGPCSTPPTKPTWDQADNTLESIVSQAITHKEKAQTPARTSTGTGELSRREGTKICGIDPMSPPPLSRKRTCSDFGFYGRNVSATSANTNTSKQVTDHTDIISTCASISTTVFNDSDTTLMTLASFESPPSFKTKTIDEDSVCHGPSETREEGHIKGEMGRSISTRRSRSAAVHNQSERRRRDRINQKMKELQKLVPNASSKTDKASMLDEVIACLKQLQSQLVQLMNMRNMSQVVMPLAIQQQQLQMSFLARMGIGFGIGMGPGMIDPNKTMPGNTLQSFPPVIHYPTTHVSPTIPTSVPTPLMVPTMVNPMQEKPEPGSNSSLPQPDPLRAYLTQMQAMNADLYYKMAEIYRQQAG